MTLGPQLGLLRGASGKETAEPMMPVRHCTSPVRLAGRRTYTPRDQVPGAGWMWTWKSGAMGWLKLDIIFDF